MTEQTQRRSAIVIMTKLIALLGRLVPVMVLAVTFGVVGFLLATALGVLGGIGLLNLSGINEATFLRADASMNYPFADMAVSAIVTVMITFAILRSFLQYAEQLCNHFIAFKILAAIRHMVFAKMRQLAPAKLEHKRQGDLVAMVTSDIELLEVFYAHTISPILIALLTCAVLIGFQATIHPIFALIAAVCYLLVGVLIPMMAAGRGRAASTSVRQELGAVNAFFLESLTGIRELLQYAQAKKRVEQAATMTESVVRKQTKLKKDTGIVTALVDAVIIMGAMAVLAASLWLGRNGSVTMGQGFIATLTLIASFGPVAALAGLGTTLLPTLAAGDRILHLLEEEPQVKENLDGQTPDFATISLEKVSFAYDQNEVLHDFSMTVKPGRILGIAGGSGRGKSTILKLMMRFWDVGSGRVTADGVDLRHVCSDHISRQVAYMTQQTVLFTGTIGDNIRIGKPDATEEELIRACRRASIYELIEALPQGFDTWITELGENFSGGERQRIGLARCLLSDHRLLLLDEPTSNLDRINEAMILRALKQETAGKTVVLVSHRASTMSIADEVLYL